MRILKQSELFVTSRLDIRRAGTVWIASVDGVDVGSLQVGTGVDMYGTTQSYVSLVSVNPNYRRQGIARALWEAAGRPLHNPDEQTGDGYEWARAVGGPDFLPDPNF